MDTIQVTQEVGIISRYARDSSGNKPPKIYVTLLNTSEPYSMSIESMNKLFSLALKVEAGELHLDQSLLLEALGWQRKCTKLNTKKVPPHCTDRYAAMAISIAWHTIHYGSRNSGI